MKCSVMVWRPTEGLGRTIVCQPQPGCCQAVTRALLISPVPILWLFAIKLARGDPHHRRGPPSTSISSVGFPHQNFGLVSLWVELVEVLFSFFFSIITNGFLIHYYVRSFVLSSIFIYLFLHSEKYIY